MLRRFASRSPSSAESAPRSDCRWSTRSARIWRVLATRGSVTAGVATQRPELLRSGPTGDRERPTGMTRHRLRDARHRPLLQDSERLSQVCRSAARRATDRTAGTQSPSNSRAASGRWSGARTPDVEVSARIGIRGRISARKLASRGAISRQEVEVRWKTCCSRSSVSNGSALLRAKSLLVPSARADDGVRPLIRRRHSRL